MRFEFPPLLMHKRWLQCKTTMRNKLTILGLVTIGLSCSSKKETKDTGTKTISKDTFKIEGKISYKEYFNEVGNKIIEEESVNFDNVVLPDDSEILIQTKSNSHHVKSSYPTNNLNIRVFGLGQSKYDKLLWEISKTEEEPDGVWESYYKTVIHGCCGSDDGFTLYNLRDGTEFLRFSGNPVYSLIPTWNYIGYHSVSATNFKRTEDKSIIGTLYFLTANPNEKRQSLTTYSVSYEDAEADEFMYHTPEIEPISKTSLEEKGFFKAFKLFQNGKQVTQLDTAQNYIYLKYYSTKTAIIPIDEKELFHLDKILSNDIDMSKNFKMKKR
jgi:hypothetical protein